MSPRLFDALQFELEPPPGMYSACLVVWPGDRNQTARPMDRRKRWLDIEVGDEVFVTGKRRRVLEVRVYRSTRALESEPVVRSGREWMLRQDQATPVDESCHQRMKLPTVAA